KMNPSIPFDSHKKKISKYEQLPWGLGFDTVSFLRDEVPSLRHAGVVSVPSVGNGEERDERVEGADIRNKD
ncbi:MAG: hypothetical protein KDD43_17420, partial [Bdellovibrionales bacterium]|nr:hypothetical protein [Bdellovibrionales bacterium]